MDSKIKKIILVTVGILVIFSGLVVLNQYLHDFVGVVIALLLMLMGIIIIYDSEGGDMYD